MYDQKRYPLSTDFYDLFGEHKERVKSTWTRPFQLADDIQTIPDEELQQYLWSGIVEFVLKHQFARDFLGFAEQVLPWLNRLEVAAGQEYAKTIIYYILNRTEGKTVQQLLELAQTHLSAELRIQTMTFAQQLKEQGIHATRHAPGKDAHCPALISAGHRLTNHCKVDGPNPGRDKGVTGE